MEHVPALKRPYLLCKLLCPEQGMHIDEILPDLASSASAFLHRTNPKPVDIMEFQANTEALRRMKSKMALFIEGLDDAGAASGDEMQDFLSFAQTAVIEWLHAEACLFAH